MGSGQIGSPNLIPFAAISMEDGLRNSSTTMFAFTCHLSGMTTSTVTAEESESAPTE